MLTLSETIAFNWLQKFSRRQNATDSSLPAGIKLQEECSLGTIC